MNKSAGWTPRLLNILKIVRAKNGALFNLGDGHFLKEETWWSEPMTS